MSEDPQKIRNASKEEYGTWSDPHQEHPNSERSTDLSRRGFMKVMGAFGIRGIIPNWALRQRDTDSNSEPEKKEKPVSSHETAIVDFFDEQTTPETLERITESVEIIIDQLIPGLPEIVDDDPIKLGIAAYKKLGEPEALVGPILDQILKAVSAHGDFVQQSYEETSSTLGREPDPIPEELRVGLQNALEDLKIHVDALGNAHAKVTVDREKVEALIREHAEYADVIVGAFQLGEIEASYEFVRPEPRIDPIYTQLDGEDKTFFAWGPDVQASDFTIITKENNELVFKGSNGTYEVPPNQVVEFDGDLKDLYVYTEDLYASIVKQVQDETVEGRLSEESLSYFVPTSKKDRATFTEPYNSGENLDEFKLFCQSFPDKVIVQAGGNNTDIRGHNSDIPDNGFIVSGLGGGRHGPKFGTPIDRNIGCLGAEIYVRHKDIHGIEISVMSSSESTAIIGRMTKELLSAGISADQVKGYLQEQACVSIEKGVDPRTGETQIDFQISGTEYMTGYVFDVEKAKILLEKLDEPIAR